MMAQQGRAAKTSIALALLLAAALGALPLAGHFDDADSQLYRVLARHLAEGGAWLDPSYLPAVHPRYREHLPFGLWFWGAAAGLFGERTLAALALLCSLSTLALIGRVGARCFGFAAGLSSILLLGATDSFSHYAAAPHLDRLLLLLATASAVTLLKPSQATLPAWALSAALASLAALVKGPFGLLPLVAASIARAFVLRDWRELPRGAAATLAAALPVALFLLWDRLFGGGTWWSGYLFDQLLASAGGTRGDTGNAGALLPFTTLLTRFWPGLPFALFGAALGLRALVRRERSTLAILSALCFLLLALLCLPARKSWHHSLVAWPFLALLAGAAAGPWLERLLASEVRARAAFAGLALAAVIALAGALGGAARFLPRSCVIPASLAEKVPEGSELFVVAPEPDWKLIAALAEEHRDLPRPLRVFPRDEPGETRFALVAEQAMPANAGSWHELGRSGGYALFERTDR